MKKILFLLLLFCGVYLGVCFADNYDFRHVNWGMNRDEVVQAESDLKQVKRLDFAAIPKDNLAFNTEVLGKKVNLQYAFINDRLVMAYYIFTETPETKTIVLTNPYKYYVDQYTTLKESLSQKYGPPKEFEEWGNETYKTVPGSIGEHIVKGHLKIWSTWETEKTVIVLNCMDVAPNHPFHRNRIIYYDREYYQSLNQTKTIKDSDLENL